MWQLHFLWISQHFGIYALGVGGPGLESQDTKLINSPPHWLCIATRFNFYRGLLGMRTEALT